MIQLTSGTMLTRGRGRMISIMIAGAIAGGCGGGAPSGAGSSTSTSASSSAPAPAAIHAGKTIRRISGSGRTTIGSLSQKHAVVLSWTVARPPFQIVTSSGFLMVRSQAQSGRVELTPGDYAGVQVATPGRWTIELHQSR